MISVATICRVEWKEHFNALVQSGLYVQTSKIIMQCRTPPNRWTNPIKLVHRHVSSAPLCSVYSNLDISRRFSSFADGGTEYVNIDSMLGMNMIVKPKPARTQLIKPNVCIHVLVFVCMYIHTKCTYIHLETSESEYGTFHSGLACMITYYY